MLPRMSFEERRRKRSSDPLVALHYQLSYARLDGAADTLVLADDSGVMVAGSGPWAACEELAAYAARSSRRTPLSSPSRRRGPESRADLRVFEARSSSAHCRSKDKRSSCARAHRSGALASRRRSIAPLEVSRASSRPEARAPARRGSQRLRATGRARRLAARRRTADRRQLTVERVRPSVTSLFLSL